MVIVFVSSIFALGDKNNLTNVERFSLKYNHDVIHSILPVGIFLSSLIVEYVKL